jgi:hypothetical protein
MIYEEVHATTTQRRQAHIKTSGHLPTRLHIRSIHINTTKEVIKHIKTSKAQGPNQISNNHLKQLGTQGILALTSIANYSIQNNIITSIWKKWSNYNPHQTKQI